MTTNATEHLSLDINLPFDLQLTAGNSNYNGLDHTDKELFSHTRAILPAPQESPVLVNLTQKLNDPYSPVACQIIAGNVDSDMKYLVKSKLEWILGMDQNIQEFYELCREDPVMSKVIQSHTGFHNTRSTDLYESLVISVLGQQISNKVAIVIRRGFTQAFGSSIEYKGQSFWTYPDPVKISNSTIDELMKLKLSGRKSEYVQNIAQAQLDGYLNLELFQDLDNQEVIDHLCKIKGVGRWTAQWALSRGIGRPDIFPEGDLVLNKLIAEHYLHTQEINLSEIKEYSKNWKPYRTTAAGYLYKILTTPNLALDPMEST
ncbi:MAG: DNA-3-methyladenine glycosylase family protein [Dehalococcoidia bacterium]